MTPSTKPTNWLDIVEIIQNKGLTFKKIYAIIFEVMRDKTNKLLEMIENGEISKDTVIMACVKYMSEDDVADMMEANEMNNDCE